MFHKSIAFTCTVYTFSSQWSPREGGTVVPSRRWQGTIFQSSFASAIHTVLSLNQRYKYPQQEACASTALRSPFSPFTALKWLEMMAFWISEWIAANNWEEQLPSLQINIRHPNCMGGVSFSEHFFLRRHSFFKTSRHRPSADASRPSARLLRYFHCHVSPFSALIALKWQEMMAFWISEYTSANNWEEQLPSLQINIRHSSCMGGVSFSDRFFYIITYFSWQINSVLAPKKWGDQKEKRKEKC